MSRVFRVPPIDLAAVLKSGPNPQIDLRLSAYETSTRNFLKAVSNYTNRAITEITNRRNAQLAESRRIADKIQAMEAEVNQCKLKEIELVSTLEKEQQEKKDVELSIAAFRRQIASLREQCNFIDTEIEQYRNLTLNLRDEKNKENSILLEDIARVSAEVQACEKLLHCSFEGIEKDKFYIRFAGIDKTDLEREFSLVLDLTGDAYKALTCTPLLPSLPLLLDELNEDRDFFKFIMSIRNAFKDSVAPDL